MNKINLVIGCWGGKRPGNKHSPIKFLKAQHATLSKFKHNLTEITFVENHSDEVPQKYVDYLNSLPYTINNRMNDKGISYSAWIDTYLFCRERFDYYLFLEDDYFFVQDNFDDKMVSLMEKQSPCDYLCEYIMEYGQENGLPRMVAGVSNCLIKAEALKRAVDKYGIFPWGLESGAQADFSLGLTKSGATMGDFKGEYQVPFSHRKKALETFYKDCKPPLIVPFDLVNQYIK